MQFAECGGVTHARRPPRPTRPCCRSQKMHVSSHPSFLLQSSVLSLSRKTLQNKTVGVFSTSRTMDDVPEGDEQQNACCRWVRLRCTCRREDKLNFIGVVHLSPEHVSGCMFGMGEGEHFIGERFVSVAASVTMMSSESNLRTYRAPAARPCLLRRRAAAAAAPSGSARPSAALHGCARARARARGGAAPPQPLPAAARPGNK
jgi:hypothetical protein